MRKVYTFLLGFLVLVGVSTAVAAPASASDLSVGVIALDYNGGSTQKVITITTFNTTCTNNYPWKSTSWTSTTSSLRLTNQQGCNAVRLVNDRTGHEITFRCTGDKWINFPGEFNDTRLNLYFFHSYMCF